MLVQVTTQDYEKRLKQDLKVLERPLGWGYELYYPDRSYVVTDLEGTHSAAQLGAKAVQAGAAHTLIVTSRTDTEAEQMQIPGLQTAVVAVVGRQPACSALE